MWMTWWVTGGTLSVSLMWQTFTRSSSHNSLLCHFTSSVVGVIQGTLVRLWVLDLWLCCTHSWLSCFLAINTFFGQWVKTRGKAVVWKCLDAKDVEKLKSCLNFIRLDGNSTRCNISNKIIAIKTGNSTNLVKQVKFIKRKRKPVQSSSRTLLSGTTKATLLGCLIAG